MVVPSPKKKEKKKEKFEKTVKPFLKLARPRSRAGMISMKCSVREKTKIFYILNALVTLRENRTRRKSIVIHYEYTR